jgi:hypothetical protein
MATGSDFVTDALDLIGYHAAETEIEPADMQLGINILNDYMAEIDESGAAFGFTPLASEADEIRLRRGAHRAIKANLAGLLAVPFKRPISVELAASIKSANQALGRMTVKIGRVKVSGSLPVGSGNRDNLFNERFFPDKNEANF